MSSSSPPTTTKPTFLSNTHHSPTSSFSRPTNPDPSNPSLSSTTNSPEYDRGFAVGVQSVEKRLKEQAEAFKKEIEKVREQLSRRRGSVRSIGSVSEEGGSAIGEGNAGVEGVRMGIKKRESFREHEARIKAVERSFGV